MSINELITILNNKLKTLNDRKGAAYANGDLALYESTILEIEETQKAIDKLSS